MCWSGGSGRDSACVVGGAGRFFVCNGDWGWGLLNGGQGGGCVCVCRLELCGGEEG